MELDEIIEYFEDITSLMKLSDFKSKWKNKEPSEKDILRFLKELKALKEQKIIL